ncbi:helix-turn-helix transcriptional regulator [Brevibacillus daliensis]|uniref:helix-turn-helix transcriptional regulator n=1 Tax=Brevibacillus daliensis TaxID=2892995 RepID=UPI001E3B4763|nr:helix-turn-helix transcriptional regulator [Brevibacillus daliensis]
MNAEIRGRGFLLKQRSFLKFYLITKIEQQKGYGLQMLDDLENEFKPFAYSPTHTELYKSLHELKDEGIIDWHRQLKPETDLQEIKIYRIVDQEKANLYKKQMKVELDRCYGLLRKALQDNY